MTEEHKRKIGESRKRFFENNPHRKAEFGARFIKHGYCRGPRHLAVQLRRAEYRMWEHASKRARESGIPFNIEPTDIVIPELCPLLGVPIFSGDRKSHANSPSLDRIIPSLGYVKGNVWVISYRANAIKHDATLEELEMLVNNLRGVTK